jgi:hypothetical protein
VMAFLKKYSNALMIVLELGYSFYAALLIPSAITWFESDDRSLLFDDIAKMQYPFIEETREFLGLIICLLVLTFYFLHNLIKVRMRHNKNVL